MFRTFIPAAMILALCAPASAWEMTVCADPAGAPYSGREQPGYDTRIAEIIADELDADIRFVWMPDHRLRTARGFLHEGHCDVVMGVLDGQKGMLTSHAYYRTTFVFVTRADGPEVASLDDPGLANMKIGLPGGAQRTTPPAVGLGRRGHLGRIVHFGASGEPGEIERRMLSALAAGEIDLAILWGPMAGYLVTEEFTVRPVMPEIDIPFLPMYAALTLGVRPHDEALRDSIDHALAARWDEVQQILADARVPLLSLPRPVLAEVGQ